MKLKIVENRASEKVSILSLSPGIIFRWSSGSYGIRVQRWEDGGSFKEEVLVLSSYRVLPALEGVYVTVIESPVLTV